MVLVVSDKLRREARSVTGWLSCIVFFTARHHASALFAMALCPCPCPSVCLSQVGVLSKRINRRYRQRGDRSFSAAGPRPWNDIPPGLWRPWLTFDSFRPALKTHLFGDRSAYWLFWIYRRYRNKFMYVCMYLSIYLSICLSIYLSTGYIICSVK